MSQHHHHHHHCESPDASGSGSASRRRFLQAGAALGLVDLLGPRLHAEIAASLAAPALGPLPRRTLGKTGESLSVIGLGGIVVMGGSQDDANSRVAEAIDRGVNYFDVAPAYGKGEAEDKLGPALKPYRDKVFLACKTQKRDRDGAAAELRASLLKLQTDHFDLYQMHSLKDVTDDVERALGPGGAMEAFVEARQQGLIRYLGFSAHSVEAALRAIESGQFDTILYPTNFVCHLRSQFDQQPLAAAAAKNMGRLALKSMARTAWAAGVPREQRSHPKCWYEPLSDPVEAALALRWTLGQGVTAAIPPGDERLFRLALQVAALDQALTPAENEALEKLAASLTPIFPQAPRPAAAKGKKGAGKKADAAAQADSATPAAAPALPLKVGDPAPDFAIPPAARRAGDPERLSGWRGQRNVLLAFYPKVFTGGCTKQLCGYRDDYEEFRTADTEVIAISLDAQTESDRFRAEHQMPFLVLGDAEKAIVAQYGVPLKTNPAGGAVAQRSVFLIDRAGALRHIDLEYDIAKDRDPLFAAMKVLK